MMLRRALMLTSLSVLASLLVMRTSMAQMPSSADAAAEADSVDQSGSEEVVVTATRRSTSLLRTPLAVTKLDTQQLQRSGIRSIADLQFYAPGLIFSQNGAAFTSIRGVGTSQPGSAVEAGVATNLDGVYVGRASAVQLYYDLDSVEVLRGPQGTLYGRNATGGVINLTSATPSDEFGWGGNLTVGDFSKTRFDGHVTGPLSDNVAGRLALLYDRRDSYLENIAPGGPDIRGDESFGVRGYLKIKPTSARFTVDLLADYQSHDSAGQVPQNIFGVFSPSAPPGTITTVDPTKVAQSIDNQSRRKSWGLNATVTVPLGDLSARLITAYRRNTWKALNGLSASSDPRSFINTDEVADQFSAELQLLSGDSGRFRWVAGLYYFNEKVRGVYDLKAVVVEPFPIAPGVFAGPLRLDETLTQDFRNESLAAFAQGTYSVTDNFRLTLGARYTLDQKTGTGGGPDLIVDLAGILPTADYGGPASVDESWGAFTPKVGVEFDIGSSTLLYASATRGFKPGNSNLTFGSPTVRPEYVLAYEAGLKTRFADDRISASLVGFWYDYKDLQVFGIVPGQPGQVVPRFQNAAKATIKGFEAELVAKPIDGLEINFAYAYLDAKYDDYFVTPTINVAGNTLPKSPKHTVQVGVQYAIDAGDFEVVPRIEYIYRSKMFFSAFERESTAQQAYSLWNARLTLRSKDGPWDISVFGKNLGDEHYFEQVNESSDGGAGISPVGTGAFYAAPRTYGLELSLRF